MPKTPKTKLYKRVLHPNRYFIWAIIVAIIAGFALLSYIVIENLKLDSQQVYSELSSYKVYRDNQRGFIARYSSHWDIERDQSDNTIFENPHDSGEYIVVTVLPLSSEGMLRHSLNIRSENDYTKAQASYAVIRAGTAKDDADIDIAIIKTDKHLYYISGHSAAFQQFITKFSAI